MNARGKTATIRIGISSCLLGEHVRYDGGHRRDSNIIETLGRLFEFVPVCPEVAIGLGVPRAPIRLVSDPHAPRAVGVNAPDFDVTEKLIAYGARMARALDDISGYIFKSRSPSCGMQGVEVYPSGTTATGLYARAFMDIQPLLPVEEEDRLANPVLRESFIARVYEYRRHQNLARSRNQGT